MRRVIFNQKGGVGKSSIAANLAAISAKMGVKTLLIDLDPQSNSSSYLLGRNSEITRRNIAEFFKTTLSFKLLPPRGADYIRETPYANLDVITASPELADIQSALETKHKIYKLRDMIQALDEYEAIYFDTPPNYNIYTLSALIAADTCLIPYDCDEFSRQALYTLLNNVEEIKSDHNPQLYVEGIIVNQFQPRASLPVRSIYELKAEGLPVLDTAISSSVKMKESHNASIPLIDFLPNHKLTHEFVALFQELNPQIACEYQPSHAKKQAEKVQE